MNRNKVSLLMPQSLRSYAAIIASVLLAALGACKNTDSTKQATDLPPGDTATHSPRYAQGFSVRYDGNRKWVEVKTPYQGATSGYTYLLLPQGEQVPATAPEVKVIRIPLQSIACTSTSHLPLLEYLGEYRKLTGFPETDYISSEKIRERVDSGKVID